jgi:ABC-type branched-subunit amino acid transport system ATPase component
MIELELRGARAGYGPVEALHGVDLVVAHGRLTALLGSNGAGKTTLLSVLAGLVPLRAGSLSGGEQQMLAMSRALLQRPQVLLLDELSSGLAPQVAAQLLALARRLADDGTTVLLVEQYAAEALAIADHVHVLGRGSVLFSGEPGELSDGVPGVTRPVRARS